MNASASVWTFRRCPYAIRARMALDVAKLDVEYREIVLRDKPDEMLKASPKGTVPILVLPDGSVIDESLDIMHWAVSQNDPESWLPGDEDELEEIHAWVGAVDEFKPNLDRYKYANRFEDVDEASVLEHCKTYLQKLNRTLEQSSSLVSGRTTFADIASFPFVRQFHFTDTKKIAEWKLNAVLSWLDAFLSSPRFDRVMKKRKLWQPNR